MSSSELKSMQMASLEQKVEMTKERITNWYNAWCRFKIENMNTGRIRYKTHLVLKYGDEPKLRKNEMILDEQPGQVFVSFSGGKDSTVLLHIARQLYPDIEAMYVDTGLEYPEVRKFVNTFQNVTIMRPKMRFDEVIKRYGYPIISKEVSNCLFGAKNSKPEKLVSIRMQRLNGELLTKDGKKSAFNIKKYKPLLDVDFRIGSGCCDVMKKRTSKAFSRESGKIPITAQMACESRLREQAWLKNGCNAFFANCPTSNPMAFWTEQDVLQYIKENDLPIASVYGNIVPSDCDVCGGETVEQTTIYDTGCKLMTTGCQRTGCIYCAYGCHLESEPTRFQRLKETHPKQYAWCIGGANTMKTACGYRTNKDLG